MLFPNLSVTVMYTERELLRFEPSAPQVRTVRKKICKPLPSQMRPPSAPNDEEKITRSGAINYLCRGLADEPLVTS